MITFRTMQQTDVAAGLELCRAARWNQLQRDWEIFLQLNPHGCRVACLDERIVGTVATIRYQEKFSWIGMVLVDPAQRRQGIGTQLLQESLRMLAGEATVKLDATPAGRAVYLQLGFLDEYGLSRMEGVVSATLNFPSTARPILPADFPLIQKLDAEIFGADRSAVLQWQFAGAPELAWIVMEGVALKGYCLGRYGFNFLHVGPIVADAPETAQQLIAACLQAQAGQTCILDVPQQQTDLLQWLRAKDFIEQRPFIRMYRGANNFAGQPARQFAILGPEFG